MGITQCERNARVLFGKSRLAPNRPARLGGQIGQAGVRGGGRGVGTGHYGGHDVAQGCECQWSCRCINVLFLYMIHGVNRTHCYQINT